MNSQEVDDLKTGDEVTTADGRRGVVSAVIEFTGEVVRRKTIIEVCFYESFQPEQLTKINDLNAILDNAIAADD